MHSTRFPGAETEPSRANFYRNLFKTRVLKPRWKRRGINGDKRVKNVKEAHKGAGETVYTREHATGLKHASNFAKQLVLESARADVVEHGKTYYA